MFQIPFAVQISRLHGSFQVLLYASYLVNAEIDHQAETGASTPSRNLMRDYNALDFPNITNVITFSQIVYYHSGVAINLPNL